MFDFESNQVPVAGGDAMLMFRLVSPDGTTEDITMFVHGGEKPQQSSPGTADSVDALAPSDNVQP